MSWGLWRYEVDTSAIVGHTITEVTGKVRDYELTLVSSDGSTFKFYHDQDCCESVSIEDIVGDLSDLVGSPILQAEEVSSADEPAPEDAESYTWTFYKLATIKGSVTVRWLGESNGYYGEGVTLVHLPADYNKEHG